MKKDLNIKIAILMLAFYVAGNSIISGTLVYMQRDFGITITNAEFLITLSSIATVLTILLNEKITQKIGMKACVNLGLLMVGLSSIFPVINKTYPSVILSRLMLGAGVGLFNGHSANYINVFFEGDEAARLHGMRNSFEFIGQIVLLFVAGLLLKIDWKYAFLAYFFAFLIMINFNLTIPDVDIASEEDGKFIFNRQIFFYILFAAIMIMNVIAISVRFPTIAVLSKGLDTDVSLYMTALPVAGMISGFLFGYINRKLREKTLFLGLIIYIIFNLILAIMGSNMYIYLISMVFTAFSQSLCTPYLFAEISRFVRGSQARMANNFIFIGCNVGGFVAPFFLQGVNKILNTDSLTAGFGAFSVIYVLLLLINLYEYSKIKSN